jgi:hypothetical protein
MKRVVLIALLENPALPKVLAFHHAKIVKQDSPASLVQLVKIVKQDSSASLAQPVRLVIPSIMELVSPAEPSRAQLLETLF